MRRAGFAVGLALLGTAPAVAQQATPDLVFGGEFSSKLIGDFYKPSGGPMRAGIANDSELQFYANYRSWLSINADIKLERNRNLNLGSYYPDRNTAFRSEGMTLRQLYATIRPVEDVAFSAGKLHPDFGSAWRELPGIFYGFGTDYEQDERIGFGVEWKLDGRMGEARLAGQVFYLDTGVLSNSLFSRPALDDAGADRRRKYVRWQYGPSNTGGLDSFTLALSGERIPELPGVQYQVSYTRQATDMPGGRAEQGFSASVKVDPTGNGIPITPRLGLTPYVEYAHFRNFGGDAGLTRNYVLGGVSLSQGPWGVHVTGGVRTSSGAESATDYQVNGSVTYDLSNGFEVGAGVNHLRIGGRGTIGFGPMVAYKVSF